MRILHIHDVEFYILTRNGIAPPDHEKGWKDVVLVKGGETVRFIAKFDDYADLQHPFMFHCHIALHEDEGMMGQFVVGPSTTGLQDVTLTNNNYSVHPNPAKDRLYIDLKDQTNPVYYATITNVNGKALIMMPQPQIQQGLKSAGFVRELIF
ncbi:MAG: multicopper oxidase domain-containing protein [Bacteroidetes bacterium]|nr:multicopper oxidase domain-containing protein [Bacteroidota bacterium]